MELLWSLSGFTYLHHSEQPLAHSSVSCYQRLYSPASNKVHSCTSSLSATCSSMFRQWTGEPSGLASSPGLQQFKFRSKQLQLTTSRRYWVRLNRPLKRSYNFSLFNLEEGTLYFSVFLTLGYDINSLAVTSATAGFWS